jgi:AraC-like DNA-binding protein
MILVVISDAEQWIRLARQCGYSASNLSKQLHISRRQLQRCARMVLHQGAQHWLSDQRMRVAAEMLRRSSSIKMVALELGFKQANHFSREFRRVHGLSPSEYLKAKGYDSSFLVT